MPLSSPSFTRKDAWALLALAALFLAMLLASWQRWTQPLLDHGREMNLPARIAAGERLYEDVQFLYGPFAPYFNALLYRLFGIHLSVLKTAGALTAVWILLTIYGLARRWMTPMEALVTTALVLVTCALKSTANYIQPYAYAALYGTAFALSSLAMATGRSDGATRWGLGGLFAGMALICKPEIALAALAGAGAALLAEGLRARRVPWREGFAFAAPAIAIPLAAYAMILRHVSWRVLLERNHILFSSMPPQLVHFNRHISGLAQWPRSFWFSLAGIGVFALWAGIAAVAGALLSMRGQADWRRALRIGFGAMLAGLLAREAAIRLAHISSDVTPFASAVFVLPVLIALAGWRLLRRQGDAARNGLLLAFSAFSLVSVLRAILNVTTTGPYTPFFLPAPILVYLYLLLIAAPAFFAREEAIRANIRRVTLCLLGLLVIGMAVNSGLRFRRLNTFSVASARGSFLTSPEIGAPLAAAVRYVEEHTTATDPVAALPIATTINFMAARDYPFREEIVHPGFLTGENEDEAIERLRARRVPLILIANLDTSEFRDRAFGLDYNQKLLAWIRENYRIAARFDAPEQGTANFGRAPFFITIYEANDE
ncbi:MAG: glycosyltransferase family 39 protein [Blastocatellia bacterium]|nr:glycosyltransferase family 39 protein [Blastocatellia bacterium]